MKSRVSLKKKMKLSFSVVIVIMFFLLTVMLTTYFSNLLLDNAKTYNQELVNSVRNQVDLHLMSALDLMTVAADNPLFSNASERAKPDYAWRAVDFLRNLILDHPEIQDVILLNKAGYAVVGTGRPVDQYHNFYQQPWVYERQEVERNAYFLDPHPENYYLFGGGSREVFSILYPLPDIVGNNILPDAAALLCNIHTVELEQTINDLIPVENSTIDIIDSLGISFFSGEREFPSSKESFNPLSNDPIIIEALSPLTGWKLQASIASEEVLEDIPFLLMLSLLALVTAIGITVLTASRLSYSLTQPVESMAERMKHIGKGDFSIQLYDPEATTEIASLGKDIDHMITQITEYQKRFTEAQLFALQEQINPHFLFNTLQTIQSLTISSKNKEIRRVTTLLGDILRYSMYDPWKPVPLSDELWYVECYLEIQLMRFPDLFTYSIDCPQGCQDAAVLKLLIQPIVENSIKHGFIDKKHEYQLTISALENQGVTVIVADNGKGLPPAQVARVKSDLDDIDTNAYSGIGLQSVAERIQLKFGSAYGIDIQSEEGKGTTVKIHLPGNIDTSHSENKRGNRV
ncbi:MAG: sensor histidine kinase [Spirochaetota bacterium]